MTILNFEGFDIYSADVGTAYGAAFRDRISRRYSNEVDLGTNKVYPVDGFETSGIAAQSDNDYNFVDIPLLANQYGKTIVIGIRFKTLTTSSWQIMDLGSYLRPVMTRIRILLADQVEIRRGTGTVLGTSGSVLDETTWHFIEIKLNCTQATGSYDIHVDGVSVLADAGPVDILDGGETTIDYVRIWLSTPWLIDDIYILNTDGSINNDYLDQYIRVEGYYPDTDGANTDWTPSSGTDHYAVVDEVNESTSDYLTGGTLNNVDTFTFGDVDSVDIYATKVDAYIGMDLAAGTRLARIKAISGVTTSNGADFGVGDQTEHVQTRILETDPDTSALWTAAGLNAAEFGVEVMS